MGDDFGEGTTVGTVLGRIGFSMTAGSHFGGLNFTPTISGVFVCPVILRMIIKSRDNFGSSTQAPIFEIDWLRRSFWLGRPM
jgi:hypothetical protein